VTRFLVASKSEKFEKIVAQFSLAHEKKIQIVVRFKAIVARFCGFSRLIKRDSHH
jgi:hypothetical protein